ncbi:MAG: ATP-binding protein [Acidimicrobiia bacterium]|nr:ATP-binding protein [Acidimicrobiia bacterium]
MKNGWWRFHTTGVLRRNLVAAFEDPGADSPSLKFYRESVRVRALLGLLLALCAFLAPGFDQAESLVVGGAVLGYVVFATIVDVLLAGRSVTIAVAINVVVGMGGVFAVSVIVPAALVPALFTYVLGLVFFTVVGGSALGVPTALLVMVCAVLGQWAAPASERVSAFVIATYLPYLLAIVFVIDGLTRKRRHTTRQFERLYEALRDLSPEPDFGSTLESVARSLGDAVGASQTTLLLYRGGDDLVVATPMPNDGLEADDLATLQHSVMTGDRDLAPLADAAETGEVVVIPDITDDPRYPEWVARWSPLLREGGHRSLLAVPLRVADETIGLLVPCFPWRGALEGDELALLEGYAEQIALVVVRARAYDQERRAAKNLEETDRLRSEFLAMVAHELRTPLTASKGFVNTVLTYWDRLSTAERKDLLGRAERNQDELARLIDQLLDFTQLDAGRVTLRAEVGTIDDSVERAVADLEDALSGHTVVVDLEARQPVEADVEAIRRVTVNLLTNAAKFSPHGSTITVSTRDEDSSVVVRVADEGIGIGSEDLERVFEPYFQVERSERSRMGTGIGLAIARRFVEMHNGQIWLEERPGGGTVAAFALPASSAADLGLASPAGV